MKKLSHLFSAFLCLTIILSSVVVTAGAVDTAEEVEGFTPTSTSTYGDLYRYFEPEEFYSLPKDVQEAYNNMPLEPTSNTNDVSTTAVEECLWYFQLAPDVTKNSVKFAATILTPRIVLPYAGVTVNLYDVSAGKYIKFFSDSDSGEWGFLFEDEFTGLKSHHKYKLSAGAAITLPTGYFGETTKTLMTDVKTK